MKIEPTGIADTLPMTKMSEVFGLSRGVWFERPEGWSGVDLTGDPETVGPVDERGAWDGAGWEARFGRPSRRCRRHPGGNERGARDTSVWESEESVGLEVEVWEPAIYKSY